MSNIFLHLPPNPRHQYLSVPFGPLAIRIAPLSSPANASSSTGIGQVHTSALLSVWFWPLRPALWPVLLIFGQKKEGALTVGRQLPSFYSRPMIGQVAARYFALRLKFNIFPDESK